MMIGSMYHNKLTLYRESENNRVWRCECFVDGDVIHAPEYLDVRRGDMLVWDGGNDHYIVKKVRHYPQPGRGGFGHVEIDIMPYSEWNEEREAAKGVIINQHVGSAQNVAGRDLHSTIHNITHIQFLQILAEKIENDANIPEEEKKNLLQKVKELINNPYVANLATAGLVEAVKPLFG